MNKIFTETKRLILRKMEEKDFEDVACMLQNPNVMYAWEYEFSIEDVYDWIKKNQNLYEKYSLGYFLAVEKSTNKIVGQIALMPDFIEGKAFMEVGYILKQEFWNQGYAKEGAEAMINFAFKTLGCESVIAEIRPNNLRSRKVAENLGMVVTGDFIKKFRDKEMLHLIYTLENNIKRF